MELPIGNFFEVTINSNKLYSFMEEISRKMETQEAQMASLSKAVGALTRGMEERLSHQENTLLIELQKVKKLNQQESNYFKLYMKDVDKKMTEKLVETEENIAQLSKKLNSTKEAIEEDVSIKLSYLEKKIQNLTAVEELEGRVREELGRLAASIARVEEEGKRSQESMESHMKKHSEVNESIIERLNFNEGQKRSENDNFMSIASSFREVESVGKSKRKERPNNTFFQDMEGLSDNLEAKMEELQEKLSQEKKDRPRRSIISNNKIVKYHESVKKASPRGNFPQKQENRVKELEATLVKRLGNIEQLAVARLAQFEKELIRHSNKSEIIDEHIGILSRKIEKEKARVNEVADSVRFSSDKKVDEKMIEGLRNAIKKMSKDFQEALQLKLNREVYEKERQRIFERLAPLSDAMLQKADKSQVRKGLSFLQQKLKEIIIVVAQQRSSNQDGAIKKTPFKCLSCDKDLESEKQQSNPKLNKENSSCNLRANTTQMRKRIRLINNTVSTVNDD